MLQHVDDDRQPPPVRLVTPAEFRRLAESAGWLEKVVRLLAEYPYPTCVFGCGGQRVRIQNDRQQVRPE
jgi:hypothetical protein